MIEGPNEYWELKLADKNGIPKASLPCAVKLAVPAVGIALRIRLLVLFPQKLKGYVLAALQFPVDRPAVRQTTFCGGRDRRRWKQTPLQRHVIQIGRQRPTQFRRFQTLKIALDGASAYLADRGDLPRDEVRFKMKS